MNYYYHYIYKNALLSFFLTSTCLRVTKPIKIPLVTQEVQINNSMQLRDPSIPIYCSPSRSPSLQVLLNKSDMTNRFKSKLLCQFFLFLLRKRQVVYFSTSISYKLTLLFSCHPRFVIKLMINVSVLYTDKQANPSAPYQIMFNLVSRK